MSKHFGVRARAVRESKGMTQTELGKLLGKYSQEVSRIENTGRLSLGNAIAIADALDVSLDYLTGRLRERDVETTAGAEKRVVRQEVEATILADLGRYLEAKR